jgi:hypothetical protein
MVSAPFDPRGDRIAPGDPDAGGSLMMRSKFNRGVAGIAALALALGPAGAAFAKPVDDPSSPNVKHPPVQDFQVVSLPTARPASDGDSAWPYVAIGGGAIGLAVAGVGGAVVASQRRHRRVERPGSTIAA